MLTTAEEEQQPLARRERFVVFLSAYILAFALWFAVNVNREYSLSINMPIEVDAVPSGVALAEALPVAVSVSVNGDWWQLASIYSSPPTLALDLQDNSEVNLFNEVRNQFNATPNIRIDKVQPSIIAVNLEERAEKRIPIRLSTQISYQEQFGMVGRPTISPDSITISGARSIVESLDEWTVDEVITIEDAREDINVAVPLISENPLISLSDEALIYTADISEFTEGEKVVFINTKDLPRNQNISYNPSSLTIRYDVPIEEFADSQDLNLFDVFVPFRKILDDSTGYVTPDIEIFPGDFHITLRDFQPKQIGYFIIVDE